MTIFLNNVDTFFKNIKIFCSITSHLNNYSNSIEYQLPNNSFFEREGLVINSEGQIQKSLQILTPANSSRNSDDFFKLLIKMCKNSFTNTITLKWLLIDLPFLTCVKKTRVAFSFNFLNFMEMPHKVYLSMNRVFLKKFYMTDTISKNSTIMAECTLFLKNNLNFF